ncbi:DegT/DnrJ/EryC1/StrS family aminotransferase [Halobellus sp. GM3]|uniref:DegT/DnrJ/EryC1/StrS family aminotransferase n=1 Tax=Halobellus sp. GM3 TaxID=3458410 RepID=UPI00403DB795
MRLSATPAHPSFRLRWLFDPRAREIPWLDDDEWLPAGERELYSWAKQGLRAVFDRLEPGSTVLLPAYVPGGVTWAALDAGLDVRYYPVNSDLTLSVSAIADRIRAVDPSVVQFIHYFGFVDDGFDALVSVARAHDALVIEDCARGLFGRDRSGRLLGTAGDVALFCPHKTLPVPEGGILVSRIGALPDPGEIHGGWRAAPRHIGRSLLARTPIDAADEPRIDQTGYGLESVAPPRRLSAPGPLTYRGLARCRPATVRSVRGGRYRALRELLRDADRLTVLSEPLYDGACPFGVVGATDSAAERNEIFHEFRRAGLPCEVLTWPPVYRHRHVRAFRGAEALRSRLLVFPTHQQLSPSAIGEMAAVVTDG